jgi:hypothetical protein
MTKLNDVSPGEWSLSHAKWRADRGQQKAPLERRVNDNGVSLGRRIDDLHDPEAMLDSPTQSLPRGFTDAEITQSVARYAAKIPDDPSALDVQVGGDHYKDFEIQPIEFITSNSLGFCEGNVIKYVCRHASKGGAADLDKAIHYLELLKEVCYESN